VQLLPPGALWPAQGAGNIREEHNEDLEVEASVVNQFQSRASLPQQISTNWNPPKLAGIAPTCPAHTHARITPGKHAADLLDGRHKADTAV